MAKGSRGNHFHQDNLLRGRLWQKAQNFLVRIHIRRNATNILTMEIVFVDVYSILSAEEYMWQHP